MPLDHLPIALAPTNGPHGRFIRALSSCASTSEPNSTSDLSVFVTALSGVVCHHHAHDRRLGVKRAAVPATVKTQLPALVDRAQTCEELCGAVLSYLENAKAWRREAVRAGHGHRR